MDQKPQQKTMSKKVYCNKRISLCLLENKKIITTQSRQNVTLFTELSYKGDSNCIRYLTVLKYHPKPVTED